MNEALFESYSLDDLLIPKDNSTVKMNMYWIVKDGKVFRHKFTKVWQCNKNESVVQNVANTCTDVEVQLLPYAYVPGE